MISLEDRDWGREGGSSSTHHLGDLVLHILALNSVLHLEKDLCWTLLITNVVTHHALLEGGGLLDNLGFLEAVLLLLHLAGVLQERSHVVGVRSSVQKDRVSLGLSPLPLISLDLHSILSIISLLLNRLQTTDLNFNSLNKESWIHFPILFLPCSCPPAQSSAEAPPRPRTLCQPWGGSSWWWWCRTPWYSWQERGRGQGEVLAEVKPGLQQQTTHCRSYK